MAMGTDGEMLMSGEKACRKRGGVDGREQVSLLPTQSSLSLLTLTLKFWLGPTS